MPLAGQDALVKRGYDHFYNLEYEEALADFEQAIAQDPEVPDLHNHVAEALVFREMYRNGALESELVSGANSFLRRPKLNPTPENEKHFLGEIARSMNLCQARLQQNPNNTAALYAMGIAYGLRSNYYWVVKKAWRDSLRDATDARRAHDRVAELDPRNVDARLVSGLDDYIVGSLPLAYRMLGFMIGIRGDKERGIRTVQEVAAHGNLDRVDAEPGLHCQLTLGARQALKLAIQVDRGAGRSFHHQFRGRRLQFRVDDGRCPSGERDALLQILHTRERNLQGVSAGLSLHRQLALGVRSALKFTVQANLGVR